MICNEYAYQVAKALVSPELTIEFAACVTNGELQGSDIWDEVCTLVRGWCNDANVFVAWDKMGRPDEGEYMELDYDLERDPNRRRAIVANARITAMAELVADTLPCVVEEILVRDGWTIRPAAEVEAETDPHGVGWVEDGCDALGFVGKGYLFAPSKAGE